MSKRFDAIVVGAGPAGCASALTLAKEGARLLCLERGESPGAKNTSGGVLYGNLLQELIRSPEQRFPYERKIVSHVIKLADKENLLSLHYEHLGEQESRCGFSVLRGKFDRWLSQQVEKEGAMVLTEAVVDDIIWKDGRAVGVKVRRPQGEVFGDLIILADGVNSLLSKKAGLRNEYRPSQMVLAVKEVIKLPEKAIEERFNLKNNEGVACLMIGDPTNGIEGAGFLYTNQNSLSLGVGCHLNALIRQKAKIHELLERFEHIDWISRFIQGGIIKEYSAHLIPVLGHKERPRMVTDGILVVGDAAGLTLNNGYILRGMDFALASGIAAGETGLEALNKGDFSYKALGGYEERLKASFVLKDLKRFNKARNVMKSHALYAIYPGLLGKTVADMFTITGEPNKRMTRLLWDHLKEHKTLSNFVWDCFRLVRSI